MDTNAELNKPFQLLQAASEIVGDLLKEIAKKDDEMTPQEKALFLGLVDNPDVKKILDLILVVGQRVGVGL